jgi:GDP-D-mannose 3', 5'-epimerase
MVNGGRALVVGAGGFIGHNLVRRLKNEGWHVTGIDLVHPKFEPSPADEFNIVDAAHGHVVDKHYHRIYQLAADMGGAGHVFTGANDAEILANSAGININVLNQARQMGVGAIFYSSSVCVYPDDVVGREEDAYPANPPSNYGFEKLFSERLYLALAKNHGLNVRIARFHNCFGPFGTFEGGREKAPAAICRKVVEAADGGEIEIWGDGEQLRPFIFIEDLLDGIEALMRSGLREPVNLGPISGDEVTINQLVDMACRVSGKQLRKNHVPGPTGGQTRRANNDLARKELSWSPRRNLKESLELTYRWVESQIERRAAVAASDP